jgi:hypothetical protein
MLNLPKDSRLVGSDGRVVQPWNQLFGLFAGASAFSAHKNGTDQTAIVSATPTKLTFGTEVFDENGYWDATNSIWKPRRGLAALSACALINVNVVDQNPYFIYVYKNNVQYKSGSIIEGSGTGGVAVNVFMIDKTDGDDTYEIYIQGNGAGNKTVSGSSVFTYAMGLLIPGQ